MNLAFLIYSYFPHGGQQRDFMRIARSCQARGHQVRVYTLKWQGEIPVGFDVRLVPVQAMTRDKLYPRFSEWVRNALANEPVDAVIGFNRMPGLDIYYAADPCFAEKAVKERPWYYRFTPRYRHFSEWETAVFGAASETQVLLLTDLQRQQYLRHYPRSAARMHMLPPGVSPDRKPGPDADERRRAFRDRFGLRDDSIAILQVGSGFRVKGVDRSLHAIASLPEHLRRRVRYFLVGEDKQGPFRKLAERLFISEHCVFTGGRDDVPDFLLGCDLMLHPAYSESAGYVLLEGLINGLPVLATDSCGYASHVLAADAGEVCPSPFRQADLDARLLSMLDRLGTAQWQKNGRRYGEQESLYSLPDVAADRIEEITSRKTVIFSENDT